MHCGGITAICDEYCRIAKSTRDVEMNQAIRLLDICFPLPVKLKLLREHTVTCEKDADITVSTAHRSKGLEWPVVILDEDFADITDPLMPEDERRDETNLLYVAVTRARKTLGAEQSDAPAGRKKLAEMNKTRKQQRHPRQKTGKTMPYTGRRMKMLNRPEKNCFPVNSNTSSTETTTPETARQPEHLPEGFYIPRTAEELTSTPRRKQCLKQLWENSSMPSDVYQQFCLTPVQKLLMAAQNVPAAGDSRWADANGFGDLTLQFTTYAVRLARGYMFPPGATPEEQAAQSGVWNAVVFWSALFYHLPLLAHLEGELVSGKLWQPGCLHRMRHFVFATDSNICRVQRHSNWQR
ncbi:helicase/Zfx/Zfy transcription activation region domain-containing protein [Escherichia coli]|uniref:Helicase/Zfx/Zfy transcription activation region domain-containing protein n=1 Tax=Escherichia coli TaxID=562 RepID=A0A376KNK5_ECOLX|nr:helicase/Zfx/Zfy transcription activation region domain-containing protein [Escherichia coli]